MWYWRRCGQNIHLQRQHKHQIVNTRQMLCFTPHFSQISLAKNDAKWLKLIGKLSYITDKLIPIWHIWVFFPLLQIVTSLNIYMIHFSTFISRENDSVVSVAAATVITCCFLKGKNQPNIKIHENPKASHHPLSQPIKSIFLSGLFVHFLVLILSLEQEITQLGPEGDCGDTRWSSQCGELFWSVTIFNLHPKSKTNSL